MLEPMIDLNESQQRAYIQENIKDEQQLLDDLAEVLQHPTKRLWPVALQVIRFLGYPRNASLLPVVVDHLCDGNWPGWSEAIEALKEIHPTIVAPLLIALFLDQGKMRVYWKDDIGSVCLALAQMDEAYVLPCIPSLVYILSRFGDAHEIEVEFVLYPLETVSVQNYVYSIPIILQLLESQQDSETRERLTNLLKAYKRGDLDFYKDLLPKSAL